MKHYSERPMSGVAQKAWDYATCKFGKIHNMAFISGCRQKGFWHCIMQDGSNKTFLNSEAVNWYYQVHPDCK